MEDVKRILVVSRDTQYDRKAVHYGFSLARQYGAQLYVMHAVHNSFSLQGWNLPIPSLVKEYKRLLRETRKELAAMIVGTSKNAIIPFSVNETARRFTTTLSNSNGSRRGS